MAVNFYFGRNNFSVILSIKFCEKILEQKYKNLYFREFNEYPKEEIGHGGTECSSIKKRIADLDIISIGANMVKIHSIDETTYISSWLKTFNFLIKFLESL